MSSFSSISDDPSSDSTSESYVTQTLSTESSLSSITESLSSSSQSSITDSNSSSSENANPVVWAITGPPTQTSVRVSFELTNASSDVVVEVRDYYTDAYVAESSSVTLDVNKVGQASVTGLSTNTRYKYRIYADGYYDPNWIGEFYTAPDPSTNPSYRIALTSDNGDATTAGPNGPIRMYDVIGCAPRLFFGQGDCPHMDANTTNRQRYRDRWKLLFARDPMPEAFRRIPYVYCIGDHDFNNDNSDGNDVGGPACREVFEQFFPHLVGDAGTGVDGTICHYFIYGKIRHVLIDERSNRNTLGSNNPLLGADQLQWLKDQISAAADNGQVVFLHMHAPWNSTSTSEDNWGEYTTERTEIMDHIQDVGMQNSVAVFHGDAHMLAYDDGTNTKYSTDGSFGLPTVCTASMDRGSSTKGGPWSGGTRGGTDQFGYADISSNDSVLRVDLKLIDSNNTVWSSPSFELDFPTGITSSSTSASGSESSASSDADPSSGSSGSTDGDITSESSSSSSISSESSYFTVSSSSDTTPPAALQVQSAEGDGGDTDITTLDVTFDYTATSGNTLICCIGIDKNSGTITLPSGYTLIQEITDGSGVSGALCYKISDGTETSATFSWANARKAHIIFMEYSGLDPTDPLDQSVEADGNASTSRSITVGPTGTTTQAFELALAFWMNDSNQSAYDGSDFSWSDGFTEDLGTYGTGSTGYGQPGMSSAYKNLISTGTVSTTWSYTGASDDENIAFLATFKIESDTDSSSSSSFTDDLSTSSTQSELTSASSISSDSSNTEFSTSSSTSSSSVTDSSQSDVSTLSSNSDSSQSAAATPTLVQSVIEGDDTKGTSRNVSLSSTATSGNLLVCIWAVDKDSGTLTLPSGFTLIQEHTTGSSISGAIGYKISDGTETSFTASSASSNRNTLGILEFSGIDTSDPLDVSVLTDGNSAEDRSLTIGPTASTDEANELALSFWMNDSAQSMAQGSDFSWSDSFSEILYHRPDESNQGQPGVSVGRKDLSSTGTVSTTFSYTGDSTDQDLGMIATFHLSGAAEDESSSSSSDTPSSQSEVTTESSASSELSESSLSSQSDVTNSSQSDLTSESSVSDVSTSSSSVTESSGSSISTQSEVTSESSASSETTASTETSSYSTVSESSESSSSSSESTASTETSQSSVTESSVSSLSSLSGVSDVSTSSITESTESSQSSVSESSMSTSSTSSASSASSLSSVSSTSMSSTSGSSSSNSSSSLSSSSPSSSSASTISSESSTSSSSLSSSSLSTVSVSSVTPSSESSSTSSSLSSITESLSTSSSSFSSDVDYFSQVVVKPMRYRGSKLYMSIQLDMNLVDKTYAEWARPVYVDVGGVFNGVSVTNRKLRVMDELIITASVSRVDALTDKQVFNQWVDVMMGRIRGALSIIREEGRSLIDIDIEEYRII